MDDKAIIDLLFRPSFSTAEKISDVSGRGVGLDVVKTKIEGLGGDIEVHTELGEGSTFIIRLPLTLAIIQALMVTLGDEKYAIPLSTIQTIEDIPISDIKYVRGKEVISIRENVIPIIRLREILDVTIVIKSLGKHLNNNKLLSGATILGDGEVALILDVNTLL